MEIDEKVFEQIKQYNEDWINKITKQNREPERNVLLEGSDKCQDTLGTRVSSTESESCLPNSPLLPNITDYRVTEMQDQLLEQGKQIRELQSMMQLVDPQRGMIPDTVKP